MSDVWKELEERLKQKAKSEAEIQNSYLIFEDEVPKCRGFTVQELEKFLEKRKWVRLEDVKEAIQQLKQNYVLVKIGDLEAIVCTSTDYDSLRDIVDDFCGNYDDVAREAYALGMKDLGGC